MKLSAQAANESALASVCSDGNYSGAHGDACFAQFSKERVIRLGFGKDGSDTDRMSGSAVPRGQNLHHLLEPAHARRRDNMKDGKAGIAVERTAIGERCAGRERFGHSFHQRI
jgi:hypothetical protein